MAGSVDEKKRTLIDGKTNVMKKAELNRRAIFAESFLSCNENAGRHCIPDALVE